MNFENKLSSKKVYYSRYIASFNKACIDTRVGFKYGLLYSWLKTLNLSEDEADAICFLAFNGKIELEENARKYLTDFKDS